MDDPLAQAIGLVAYATKSNGIGGMIKARVTDFRVDEIATQVALDNKGRFTVAKVTLTNWETNRFCNQLASALRIPRNRIFFAGTKDKRAVTSQLFVIDAPIHKVAEVELPDVEIEVLGRTHQKIGFGNHKGNRFTIVVRGCCDREGRPLSEDEALAEVERIRILMEESLGPNRFPNWIGPQRFGAGRPVTPIVGRYAVQGNWQDAVMTYLCMEGDGEEDEAHIIRQRLRQQGIEESVLEDLPRWMGFERSMIEHLVAHPDDFLGAFRTLPSNLQLMTIHALQSIVFNKSMHQRIEAGLPLSTPIEGDIVGRIDDKGQLDTNSYVTVESRTLSRISRNCELGRLTTTGPLPGADHVVATGRPGEIERQAIQAEGLHEVNWNIEDIPRLTTTGTRRGLIAHFDEFSVDTVPIADARTMGVKWELGPAESDRWHPEGACIRFRFTLSSGSYATVLLREFIQGPLANM